MKSTSTEGVHHSARFARLERLANSTLDLLTELNEAENVEPYRIAIATARLERDLEDAVAVLAEGTR